MSADKTLKPSRSTASMSKSLAPRVTIVVSPRERFEQAPMSLAAILDSADVPSS
jgi:hypothetical protein